MTRPPRHLVMMELATVIAQRSTCRRRRVGCVLTDAWGRVLSMGHNGVPMGMTHCTDEPCPGADLPSGTGLDECSSAHAEVNSLLFCPDPMRIDTCWVTASPCVHCVKLLMNTTCRTIVYLDKYPHDRSRELWTADNRLMLPRRWLQLEEYE
jgi:dCMP deaminase